MPANDRQIHLTATAEGDALRIDARLRDEIDGYHEGLTKSGLRQ
jgi:hypothetical protein